jgi:hypothetical protein
MHAHHPNRLVCQPMALANFCLEGGSGQSPSFSEAPHPRLDTAQHHEPSKLVYADNQFSSKTATPLRH